MSGRIRSVKPEILEDEKTAGLDDHTWRLFVSLFCLADDYGNLRGSADWLHGQVFWKTPETIQQHLPGPAASGTTRSAGAAFAART